MAADYSFIDPIPKVDSIGIQVLSKDPSSHLFSVNLKYTNYSGQKQHYSNPTTYKDAKEIIRRLRQRNLITDKRVKICTTRLDNLEKKLGSGRSV